MLLTPSVSYYFGLQSSNLRQQPNSKRFNISNLFPFNNIENIHLQKHKKSLHLFPPPNHNQLFIKQILYKKKIKILREILFQGASWREESSEKTRTHTPPATPPARRDLQTLRTARLGALTTPSLASLASPARLTIVETADSLGFTSSEAMSTDQIENEWGYCTRRNPRWSSEHLIRASPAPIDRHGFLSSANDVVLWEGEPRHRSLFSSECVSGDGLWGAESERFCQNQTNVICDGVCLFYNYFLVRERTGSSDGLTRGRCGGVWVVHGPPEIREIVLFRLLRNSVGLVQYSNYSKWNVIQSFLSFIHSFFYIIQKNKEERKSISLNLCRAEAF